MATKKTAKQTTKKTTSKSKVPSLLARVKECERIIKENDRFLTQAINNAATMRTEFDNFKTEVERLLVQNLQEELIDKVQRREINRPVDQAKIEQFKNSVDQGLIEQNATLLETESELRSNCQDLEGRIYELEQQIQELSEALFDVGKTFLDGLQQV